MHVEMTAKDPRPGLGGDSVEIVSRSDFMILGPVALVNFAEDPFQGYQFYKKFWP